MTKTFNQIMEGLHEALAVARGENTGAKLHVPEDATALEVARNVMKRRRNMLRELAKS
jgi:hypothetical protein